MFDCSQSELNLNRMTVDVDAIIKLVTDVAGTQEIQVTVSESLKGAVITGTFSLIGGLVAGPVGLALGGASGGLLAAYKTKGKFKSVSQVLSELPYERKRRIAIQIESILNQLDINDVAEFSKLVLMIGTVAQGNPQNIIVHKFIQESLKVIQREMMSSGNNDALTN